MKTLKFQNHLVPLILSGVKTTTWRLFDDKDLQAGDEVEFLEFDRQQKFALARLVSVVEKTFMTLSPEDWEGHEKFKNMDELLKFYSQIYNQTITPDMKVKIIKFTVQR